MRGLIISLPEWSPLHASLKSFSSKLTPVRGYVILRRVRVRHTCKWCTRVRDNRARNVPRRFVRHLLRPRETRSVLGRQHEMADHLEILFDVFFSQDFIKGAAGNFEKRGDKFTRKKRSCNNVRGFSSCAGRARIGRVRSPDPLSRTPTSSHTDSVPER